MFANISKDTPRGYAQCKQRSTVSSILSQGLFKGNTLEKSCKMNCVAINKYNICI